MSTKDFNLPVDTSFIVVPAAPGSISLGDLQIRLERVGTEVTCLFRGVSTAPVASIISGQWTFLAAVPAGFRPFHDFVGSGFTFVTGFGSYDLLVLVDKTTGGVFISLVGASGATTADVVGAGVTLPAGTLGANCSVSTNVYKWSTIQ